MSNADEKLCLQWNDFKENVSSTFGDLRQDKDFTDVTLACEDGQQVEAHKVVLVASSPFFLNILKRNKHPHPLIFMRGVKPENLMAMVDFLYHGETNVDQENIDFFLILAEELQLKGLRGNKTENETEVSSTPTKRKSPPKLPKYRSAPKQFPLRKDFSLKKYVGIENGLVQAAGEKALALSEEATNNTDLESLDQQVKSMMVFSENADPYQRGRARRCKVCGKEGNDTAIKKHIEAHHIAGISIPCGLCGKQFKSRNSLANHKSVYHNSQ